MRARFGSPVVLAGCLLLAAAADAAVLQDVAIEDEPARAGVPKGGLNLEIGSLLLRADGDDAASDPITHNVQPGDLLRPQVRYRVEGLDAATSHRIRILIDGETWCEGDVQIEEGSRLATCSAFEFSAGVTTIVAEIDVAGELQEIDENDNTVQRAYDTRIDDPLDLAAERVRLVTAREGGAEVTDPIPGDEVFVEFTFDVSQSINWYWRAEIGVDGERLCGVFFASPDPGGSRWTISCSTPLTVPDGAFSIYGSADYRFEQNETDEFNNEAFASFDPGSDEPPGVVVSRLRLPFFCCTPPPPATRLGAVISSDGGLTAVGEPFSGDGRIAVFSELFGFPNSFEELLFIPDGFDAVNFGSAVAVEGDLMVVGAPVFEPAQLRRKGGNEVLKAALYERLAEGWSFKLPIAPEDDSQVDDQFGFAIDIEGDMIVIGAPSDAEGEPVGEGSGAVYTFEYDGSSIRQLAKAKPQEPSAGQGFGAAIAASRDKIAVAAPFSPVGQAVAGSVTLFDAVANNLRPLGTVAAPDARDGDGFGTAIDLAGDLLVVGAPGSDLSGADAGAAFSYRFSGNTLSAEGVLLAPDASPGAGFGSAVATNGAETTVGAPEAAGSAADTSGAIYRFAGTTPRLRIGAPPSLSVDDPPLLGFGASLDLTGADIAIGAPRTDEERGAAAIATGLPDGTYSGPWFSAGQSGHGWFVEHLDGVGEGDPDRINVYWYVYLGGEPVWLTGQGDLEGDRAELTMFITAGADFPPAFATGDVDLIPWGTLVFQFDGEGGTASWNSMVAGFGSGELPMQRIAPIAGAADACRSGSYYNIDQSGHGFVMQVFEIAGRLEVLVAWYVYQDGEQVWLLGQATITDDAATVPLTLFTGADFPPRFDTDDVAMTDWGTLEIAFTGPDGATVSWTSDLAGYPDGSLGVVRLTTLRGRPCGE